MCLCVSLDHDAKLSSHYRLESKMFENCCLGNAQLYDSSRGGHWLLLRRSSGHTLTDPLWGSKHGSLCVSLLTAESGQRLRTGWREESWHCPCLGGTPQGQRGSLSQGLPIPPHSQALNSSSLHWPAGIPSRPVGLPATSTRG